MKSEKETAADKWFGNNGNEGSEMDFNAGWDAALKSEVVRVMARGLKLIILTDEALGPDQSKQLRRPEIIKSLKNVLEKYQAAAWGTDDK